MSEPKPMKCFRCGGFGHSAQECATPEKVCHNCGRIGHMKKQCYVKVLRLVDNDIECSVCEDDSEEVVVDNIVSSSDGVVAEEDDIGLVQSVVVAKVNVVRTSSISQIVFIGYTSRIFRRAIWSIGPIWDNCHPKLTDLSPSKYHTVSGYR